MLQLLRIQNYVLIEDLEMNVSKGLTIITGETGAGKTILLGALSLILGQRADSSVLRDRTRKCIIEGHFNIHDYHLQDFFTFHELDYESITSLRREISAEGKSRAFINDTPVNLNQLKELGSMLVDIHSQHETLTLQHAVFQLRVTDAFSKHDTQLTNYRLAFKTWQQHSAQLNELLEAEKKSRNDLDYFQFQFTELEQAGLKDGEQEVLQTEMETLSNAEEIKSKLVHAVTNFQEGDFSVISQLEATWNILRSVSRFNSKIEIQTERVKSTLIEVKDIAAELGDMDQHILYDAERILFITERLNLLIGLQQKHRVSSVSALLQVQEQLASKLLKINSLEDEIVRTTDLVNRGEVSLRELASALSGNRRNASIKIEKEIKNMLAEVGMPHAQLKIEQVVTENLNENGMDRIKFLFSANKGIPLQEIGKVASGGELSRLMLCIKALMARLVTMPTIVFDEIDSGISGEIAFKVGSIIEKMASKHQVMAITHLPQMASRGDAHLLVYKQITGKNTQTGIRILDQQERINEIAKMLSGNELTEASLENAKELLAK